MIQSSQILERLNQAEALFPVDSWQVGGVEAWPLMRIRCGFELIEQAQNGAGRSRRQSRITRARRVLGGRMSRAFARARDAKGNASLTAPAQAVFLSDGISYSQVGGMWMEKFCDPIIQQLDRMQLKSLLLSPLHEYRIPRYSPSEFIQCELDRIAFSAMTRLPEPDLPGFAEFREWFQATGMSAPAMSWLRQTCLRVHRMSEYFSEILRRTGCALALVVNYYSPTGMAFVLACRQRGIPVVDIQHGVAGDLHFAYGRWGRVPPQGFRLLPTHFWCWQRTDADDVNRWAADCGQRVILGGNPWLQEWNGDESRWVRETDQAILSIKRHHPNAVHALVTLQSRIGNDQTPHTLAMLRQAGSGVFWWIRLHPAQLAERHRIARHLGTLPAEVDQATDLPLPALLRQMDVHVTHSSSSVLEAAAMGIPSIVTSTYGAELYEAQIRNGMAVHLDGRTLAEYIHELQPCRRGLMREERQLFLSAIEELLETADLRTPAEVDLVR